MPAEVIIGAVAGLFLAFLILALRSSFTQTGPAEGIFEGDGCLASMVLYVVLAAIGAGIGFMLAG